MTSSKIYSVDTVDLALIKTNPPGLVISVCGRVTSSGWSGAGLVEYVYIRPPEDGIQDFDVVARRPDPGSIVLPLLTPITVERTLASIDIGNYWGRGMPLLGVRCHAVANSKVATFTASPGIPAARVVEEHELPSPAAIAGKSPSYAADIRPLFRTRDVETLRTAAGVDPHDYAGVKANARDILQRLRDRTVPCDGPWPQSDIDLFAGWIESGMAA